jgi:hypothetical protein
VAKGQQRAANPDLMVGLQQLANGLPDYHRAEMYYECTMPEFFASIRLRRALERTGVSFRFNLASTPVDVMADRLEIASLTCPQDEQADNALQAIWQHNLMDLTAASMHLRAGEFGDAYAIVWPSAPEPDEDDEGDDAGNGANDAAIEQSRRALSQRGSSAFATRGVHQVPDDVDTDVDIFYNSAKTTRIIYDADNPRVKRFAIKKWTEPAPLGSKAKPQTRVNLYYRGRIEKYISAPNSKGNQLKDWLRYEDPEDGGWPIENPFGEIPVFHFRTEMPYGSPEHRGAYGPQDAINKLMITQMATIDYHGFPQRYVIADPGNMSDELADFDTDDDINRFEDTGHDSTLRSGPGEVWWLNGVRQAGQFNPPNPEVFLQPLDTYTRMMAQITRTPLHYFDPQVYSRYAPSGESIRASEVPLLKKVRKRQIAYGSAWLEIFRFALKVAGITTDPALDLRWVPAATIDDQVGWAMIMQKQQAGVPVRQTLLEAGYDPDMVDSWLVNGEGLEQRVNLLSKIATAAQALGTATGFGVLEPTDVNKVIMSVLELDDKTQPELTVGTA